MVLIVFVCPLQYRSSEIATYCLSSMVTHLVRPAVPVVAVEVPVDVAVVVRVEDADVVALVVALKEADVVSVLVRLDVNVVVWLEVPVFDRLVVAVDDWVELGDPEIVVVTVVDCVVESEVVADADWDDDAVDVWLVVPELEIVVVAVLVRVVVAVFDSVDEAVELPVLD
jgi:hypothetical protein